MAEVNISYDTISKKVKATMDGKKMAFTSLMLAGKYDKPDEYNMEMYNNEKDDENDMYHMYRMMCKKYDEQKIVEKMQEFFNKK